MVRRASKTCYFLNRKARYLALVGRHVRFPASTGVWIPIAEAERAPWETIDLLAATYPRIDAQRLSFVALLSDFEVDEFEKELRERHLLRPEKSSEPGHS